MIDFFRDAPTGAIALVVVGLLVMLVEIPLRLRWKAHNERRRDGPITEAPSRLPFLIAPLPWVLIVAGLAWYVLAE